MVSHRQIFAVAWPYTLSIASGFIVQAVAGAMVAPLGTAALAALGVSIVTSFIPISFTMGLITAVQKKVALHPTPKEVNQTISSGLSLALILSLPFTIAYFFLARQIAGIFTVGPAADLAAAYLKIFCFAFVFAAGNQALDGHWIGICKTRIRLLITAVSLLLHVAGNLILIPHFGFEGVAISGAFAVGFGFCLNLIFTRQKANYRWSSPSISELLADLKIILGVAGHQLSLSFTLNAAVFIIGSISVDALAVANVITTLSLPALYLGIGYGTATGSFLVKSLELKDYHNTRAIGRRSLMQVFTVSLGLGLAIAVNSSRIRHFYFTDPNTFELSRVPMLLLAGLFIIDGLCCALQRFHFVTGGLRLSFIIMSAIQWGLFIPGAYLAVRYLGLTYTGYLGLHLVQRALIGVVLYLAWRRTSLRGSSFFSRTK